MFISAVFCALLLTVMPVQLAFAVETSVGGVDYTYEVDEEDANAIEVTQITSSTSDTVKVPGTIDGKRVTQDFRDSIYLFDDLFA